MNDKACYESYLLQLLSEPEHGQTSAGAAAAGSGIGDGGVPELRDSFRKILEELAADPHIRYGSSSVAGMGELIAEEIAGRLDGVRQYIAANSPFQIERDLLVRCSAFDCSRFAAHWEQLYPYLQRRYTPEELNLPFYIAEFAETLPTEYDNIRQEFLLDWDRALYRKEVEYELLILNRMRRSLQPGLDERIKSFYGSDCTPAELGIYWGLEPGQWQKLTVDLLKAHAALCKGNPSIQMLLDELGRKGDSHSGTETGHEERYRKHIARFAHAAHSDIDGVCESGRLDALLPAEIALLGNASLEKQFYKKFVEGRLQTFDFRSHEPVRERVENPCEATARTGPYIVCLDTSGSMRGKPEELAKAVCFGLLLRSREEQRNCYLISYSLDVQVLDLADWKHGQSQIVDFLSHSFCGGTDLEPAIRESLRMLRTGDYSLADVLVISDFELGDLSPECLTEMAAVRQRNVRFHALQIGCCGNEHVLDLFDVRWAYNSCTRRIAKAKNQ